MRTKHTLPYVVSFCDFSGVMVMPWADAGFPCVCVDIRHSIRKPRREGNVTYLWGDARSFILPRHMSRHVGIFFAFPPCTHVSNAGRRDFLTKGNRLLMDCMELFLACEIMASWSGAPYMLENPVGALSRHMRPPDFTFHPYEFGDTYSKNTCLWVGNGFRMPAKIRKLRWNSASVDKNHIWKASGPNQTGIRSLTPKAFAEAVFHSNHVSVTSLYKTNRSGIGTWL